MQPMRKFFIFRKKRSFKIFHALYGGMYDLVVPSLDSWIADSYYFLKSTISLVSFRVAIRWNAAGIVFISTILYDATILFLVSVYYHDLYYQTYYILFIANYWSYPSCIHELSHSDLEKITHKVFFDVVSEDEIERIHILLLANRLKIIETMTILTHKTPHFHRRVLSFHNDRTSKDRTVGASSWVFLELSYPKQWKTSELSVPEKRE
jgi:hypothetical protein